MAGKRKYNNSEDHEAVSLHVQEQEPRQVDGPKPAKQPLHQEPKAYKKQAHGSSVNDIKKRMRDVRRRLDRVEALPPNVRIEDERALATYERDLAEAEAEKVRQKMIKKYHMVRFFERKKAERHLKQLRKRLLATESLKEVEMLKAEMHITEVDLNYTQYSPLSEIYISLYPPQKEKHTTTDLEDESKAEDSRPKPPMWSQVEKCMEEGTLSKLRNRVGSVPVQKKMPRKKNPSPLETKPNPKSQAPLIPEMSGMNRRERRSLLRGEEQNKKTRVGKNKSSGFENNARFGASLSVQRNNDEQEVEEDGEFFEIDA